MIILAIAENRKLWYTFGKIYHKRKGGSPVPEIFSWDVRRLKETGSTNEDAFALGRSGAPAGIVVLAESQSRGRGRMDRSWFSPPGAGLYCSVLLRPSLPLSRAGLLSFCAALAMTDCLRSFGFPAGIKWPNDIVAGGRKLCGILSACEGEGDALHFAVIGSGLNLRRGSYPEDLASRAACLEEYGPLPDPEALLHGYLDRLSASVSRLEKEGFSPLRRILEDRCVLLSRRVLVSGGQQAEGTAVGIGEAGELLLRLDGGSLLPVTCGDVTVRGVNGYV